MEQKLLKSAIDLHEFVNENRDRAGLSKEFRQMMDNHNYLYKRASVQQQGEFHHLWCERLKSLAHV